MFDLVVLSKIEQEKKSIDAIDSSVTLEAGCVAKNEGHINDEQVEGWDKRALEGGALRNRLQLLGWTM